MTTYRQQCRICGCEWTATKPNLPCPNCRSLEPLRGEPFPLQGEEARKFATFYRRLVFAEDKEQFHNPIYDAPMSEWLNDLAQAVQMAQNMVMHKEMIRPDFQNAEGLKEGEFAIGNWIVRPRFK